MSDAARQPARPGWGARTGGDGAAAVPIALAVVTLAAAIRLAFAAVIPLAPDETYYWEWSRRLAAGYFDHPPAIAFLIRGGTALLGDTPLGVRLLPVLAGWGASLLLLALALRLGGAHAALRAAVIVTCIPLAAVGLVVATPSAPLMLFGAAMLLALDRAVSAAPRSVRAGAWWLVAGVSLGLALLSDYEAALLGAGALAALIVVRPLRVHLRAPAPWIAALVSLAVFVPNIRWNALHDWASYRFQLGHGLGAHPGALFRDFPAFLGGQLGVASPVLFVLAAIAVARALRDGSPRVRLQAVLVVAPLLVVTVSALRGPVEVNWTSPAYLAAIVLMAAWDGTRSWRRWLAVGCALGGILVALIYAQSVSPFLPLRAERDPTARGRGWRAVAVAADSLAGTVRRAGAPQVWLAADRYQEASELAFHGSGHPVTFSFNLSGRTNQYRYWPPMREVAHAGDDVIFAVDASNADTARPAVDRLRPHFARSWMAVRVALRRGADVRGRTELWVLEGWRGTWPADALANGMASPEVAAYGRFSVLASRIR